MPVQVTGKVIDVRRAGGYFILSVTVVDIPDQFRPGHFVTIAIGAGESSLVTRRAFAIYGAQSRGVYGASIEIVIGVKGEGSKWLSERRRDDLLNIVGPLGRPFVLPLEGVPCVVVGGGYGAAAFPVLVEQLRDRGCRVDVIIGGSTESKLFGNLSIKRQAATLTICTEDGSVGVMGKVTDVLPEIMEKNNAAVVYACGPMGMLAAVAEIASRYQAFSQCLVEEMMACGVGICMSCVLPIRGADGVVQMLRSCIEGPVFRGDMVLWDAIGTIPDNTFGSLAKDEPVAIHDR